MASPVDLTTAAVAGVGLVSLVLTFMTTRAAAQDCDASEAGQSRRRARWGAATLSGLLAVGAAGIAFMRAVTL